MTRTLSLSLLCLALLLPLPGAGRQSARPTYATNIRPLFKAHCVVCHNQATLTNPSISGGLALDSYAALQKGVVGATVPTAIFVPGKSAESELLRRLVATSASKMMPKGGPPLSPAEIALVRRWIDSGAPAGAKGADSAPTVASPAAAPMPVNPGAQDVTFATQIKPSPKDPALRFALNVGPLPPVTALAYSPDGKRLAVGGYRAILFWDTTTGQPAACITRLAGQVYSLAYRPDGQQLAVAGGVAGSSGDVLVYDTKTLMPVGSPLNGHTDLVYSVAWSTDSTRLATGSQDKTARLWEWPSGKQLYVFKDNSDAVSRVCFAPDGKALYTAGLDHNVRRYDTANGQLVRALTGHSDAVTALALSPNGRNLISAGAEPPLRWWNPDTGDTTSNNGGHGGPVNELVFSKDGKILASASADHTIRVWDTGNAQQKRAMEGANDWLYTVAISPDDKFIAGAGAEGTVQIWETETGRLRLTLISWPPAEGTTVSEWAVLTPEGYYNASPSWAQRMRTLQAGKLTPTLATFVRSLRQAENVTKAWQGAPLTTAMLPTPASLPDKALANPKAPLPAH